MGEMRDKSDSSASRQPRHPKPPFVGIGGKIEERVAEAQDPWVLMLEEYKRLRNEEGCGFTYLGGALFEESVARKQLRKFGIDGRDMAYLRQIPGARQDVSSQNSSPFTSEGNNLIGKSGGSSGFVNGVNNDQVGTNTNPIDPRLGPLQDNGGPTNTHALLSDSPAIDAVSTGCPPPATDQRGQPRPLDGDNNGTATCDIGAFEREAALPPPQPKTKAECKNGGYKAFGFKNQGQCIKYVNNPNKKKKKNR